MKLTVDVTQKTRSFLHTRYWEARFSELSATGPTKRGAEAAMEALLLQLVAEDGTPVVEIDLLGGTWVTQRENYGGWSYYHIDKETKKKRCVCLVAGGRDVCLYNMRAHMEQWCR